MTPSALQPWAFHAQTLRPRKRHPSYLHSGFSMLYPAKMLMGGPHTVTVVGIDSHGVAATLGPLAIIVAAPFGNLESADDEVTDKTTESP